jgi:hypothetical protein
MVVLCFLVAQLVPIKQTQHGTRANSCVTIATAHPGVNRWILVPRARSEVLVSCGAGGPGPTD